jgi:hypothetical protein
VHPFNARIRTDSLLLFLDEPGPALVDLSKATKLNDLVFRPGPRRVRWIIAALQTITPNHRDLRQITIRIPSYWILLGIPANVRAFVGEAHGKLWLDIDRLLIQLWETHLIRPKVICPTEGGMEFTIGYLLPEITKRGMIDVVEYTLA